MRQEQERVSSGSNSCEALRPPAATAMEIVAARERAFQRLYEGRIISRSEEMPVRTINRRSFLRAVGLGTVAVGAFSSLISHGASRVQTLQDAPEGSRPLYNSQLERVSLFAWENALFQAGHIAFGVLCGELKLPFGNASMRGGRVERRSIERVVDAFERDPLFAAKIYIEAAWLAPIAEEVMFRVIPSVCLRRQGAHWQVGIPTALAYAAAHNLVSSNAETRRAISLGTNAKLSLDYVPLNQFMLGAFFWYLARTHGELAPVLAHVFNNQLAGISLVWGGRETYQRFQQLLGEELSRPESPAVRPDGHGDGVHRPHC